VPIVRRGECSRFIFSILPLAQLSSHDLTLKEAALKLGFVAEEEFDRVVDPAKMVQPYVA